MSPAPTNSVRFTSWPLRILNSLGAAIGCLIPGAIAVDTHFEWIGFVSLVAAAWSAFRALRMGVWIDDRHCTIRNLLRTRTVLIEDVDRFDFELSEVTMLRNESVVLRRRHGQPITITVLTLPRMPFLQGPGRERCSAMNAELARRRAA